MQNNADGNCLFEAISQIYFENDVIKKELFKRNTKVQSQLRKLTALFFSRCQENKYKQHACNLDISYCFNGMKPTDNIYGEEIDLLLLSILFKFKFKVIVNAVDTHYVQTIPTFKSIDSEFGSSISLRNLLLPIMTRRADQQFLTISKIWD